MGVKICGAREGETSQNAVCVFVCMGKAGLCKIIGNV